MKTKRTRNAWAWTYRNMDTTRQQHPLESRLTHRYRLGWASEDQWETVGAYSILNSRLIEEADDYDTLDTYCVTVRVDSDAAPDVIALGLRSTFSHSDCQCEHDCCGCPTWNASDVRKVRGKRREWTLVMSGYRNL